MSLGWSQLCSVIYDLESSQISPDWIACAICDLQSVLCLYWQAERVNKLRGQRLSWERPLDSSVCCFAASSHLEAEWSRFLYVSVLFFCSISKLHCTHSGANTDKIICEKYTYLEDEQMNEFALYKMFLVFWSLWETSCGNL